MGGIGSGKYNKRKTKPTTASYNSLDLRKLNKLVTLDHLCGFTLEWKKDNEVKSSVDCIFNNDVLEIHYSIKNKNGKVSNIDYIHIAKTPCHFGGDRKWLVCPGCGSNALVLYIVNRFRCRKCHGLYHPSSAEGDLNRANRAMCNIQDKLNGSQLRPTDGVAGLSKPKWMKEKTFYRLYNQAYLRQRKFFNIYKRIFGAYLE
jgi:hypothetical protein